MTASEQAMHVFGFILGALLALSPWILAWRLFSLLPTGSTKRDGTTIDDWILRGGRKE